MRKKIIVFMVSALLAAGLSGCLLWKGIGAGDAPQDGGQGGGGQDANGQTPGDQAVGGQGGGDDQAAGGQGGGSSGGSSGARPGPGIAMPADGEFYSIRSDFSSMWWVESSWVVDRDGNTIFDDEQFSVLYDMLTGEPQCMLLTRIEGKGKDEYGEVVAQNESALFDMAGNMLYDWGSYSYEAGFGDFIIKRESKPGKWFMEYSEGAASELLDYKTGEALFPGVGFVERITEDKALLLDGEYRPLGVVDKKGEKYSGFPVPSEYADARAWNGLIIATTMPRFEYDEERASHRYFLLTPEFDVVCTHNYIEEISAGKTLCYTDGVETPDEVKGVIDAAGKELYRLASGENASYCDGRLLAINREWGYEMDTTYHAWLYKVVRLSDGETLIDDAAELAYSYGFEDEGPLPKRLLVYKDGYLQAIDADGGVAAKMKTPAEVSYMSSMTNGLHQVYMTDGSGEHVEMIVDGELNEIVPQGKYASIAEASKYDRRKPVYYDILVCWNYGGGSMTGIMDVLDLDGNILVARLNNVYDYGPDRLAVRKGFSEGLMDWQGNWIVKRSVFSELLND